MKIKNKIKVFLWYIGLLPEEICPVCGNDESFAHGFEDHNRRYYCPKCGLFEDDPVYVDDPTRPPY